MPETNPTATTQRLSFECPADTAEALKKEAKQRGVTIEELVGSMVVTPISDQLAELNLSRFDRGISSHR